MPRRAAWAGLQLLLLVAAVPLQTLIVQWSGNNAFQRLHAMRWLTEELGGLQQRLLRPVPWLSWARGLVRQARTALGEEEEEDAMGECAALEVLRLEEIDGHFASDPAPARRLHRRHHRLGRAHTRTPRLDAALTPWEGESPRGPPLPRARVGEERRHLRAAGRHRRPQRGAGHPRGAGRLLPGVRRRAVRREALAARTLPPRLMATAVMMAAVTTTETTAVTPNTVAVAR
ncbi:F-box only protein 21 isoform X1 [Lampetra fluviatilis]